MNLHANIPYAHTKRINRLIAQLLAQDEALRPLVNEFPSEEGVEKILKTRQFSSDMRQVLHKALTQQYADVEMYQPVQLHLDSLLEGKTYTITTGHQLNLFSGPLYFIYKIASAIRTADVLKEKYPQHNFVPVYWMATEDHDFEEINHTYVSGKKIEWHREAGGPVGRFSLEGLSACLAELFSNLSMAYHGTELHNIFKKAEKQNDLAGYTRSFVNDLFGKYGVVIVDGDDKALKQAYLPYAIQELREQPTIREMEESERVLKSLGHKTQVHPRQINLFYLEDGLRERIIKETDGYSTANGSHFWEEEVLIDTLKEFPERVSPNAALRPLYQEIILPNLAYVGGGGELSYWLQLKPVFDAFKVHFPLLLMRNGAGLADKAIARKIDQLEIPTEWFFEHEHEISKRLAAENEDFSVEETVSELKRLYKQVCEKATDIDPTLRQAVDARRQMAENELLKIEKKMMRAAKRKNSDRIQKAEAVLEVLFPNGGLQERKENFSRFYAEFGPKFIDDLLADFEGFPQNFKLFFV